MKSNSILLSDIKLLLQLYAPQSYDLHVFDPFERLIEDTKWNFGLDSGVAPVLVNLAGGLEQYKGMSLGEFAMILDFGNSCAASFKTKRTMRFIKNTDGRMRWMFSPGKMNSVLGFYHASNWRGKLVSGFLKLVSALQLDALVSQGKVTIFSKTEPKLDHTLQTVEHTDYAISTNDAAQTGAVEVALQRPGHDTNVIQVPLNAQNDSKHMFSDRSIGDKSPALAQTQAITRMKETPADEKPRFNGGPANGKFTSVQAEALAELFHQSRILLPVELTAYWEKLSEDIRQLKQAPLGVQMERALRYLIGVKASINPAEMIMNGMSHDDFSPWKPAGVDKNDTSPFHYSLPALFDLFHFHYWNSIMCEYKSVLKIRHDVFEALDMPLVTGLTNKYSIDVDLHHKLYVVIAASHFLVTHQSKELRLEGDRQLAAWTQALKSLLPQQAEKQCRERFLADFNTQLASVRHAFFKFDLPVSGSTISGTDIEIIMEMKDSAAIQDFCISHPLVVKGFFLRKRYLTSVELYFLDGQCMSIDLVDKVELLNLGVLTSKELLDSAAQNEQGIMILDPKYGFEYVYLCYTLQGRPVPGDYFGHFSRYSAAQVDEAIQYLNKKYALNFQHPEELFSAPGAQTGTPLKRLYDLFFEKEEKDHEDRLEQKTKLGIPSTMVRSA